MTEQTDTPQGVSTAIIVRDGKTLMIRRREREGKLLWALLLDRQITDCRPSASAASSCPCLGLVAPTTLCSLGA